MLHPCENKNFYGHVEQISILENFISSGKIPHAFLFTGVKGIGKATLAYHFAKTLLNLGSESQINTNNNSEQPEEVDSFDLFAAPEPKVENKIEQNNSANNISILKNNSRHAEKVERKVHPDLLVIDSDEIEKNEIKIDEVRKIKDFITLTPSESKSRVVVIDSADYLNNNAANAILKILEEPTKNTFIILISHQPAFILPTIKSRCREIKFKGLEQNFLDKIISENIKIKSDDTDKLNQLEYAKNISGNSAGQTIFLYKNDAFDIYNEIKNNLKQLPKFSYLNAKGLSSLVAKSNNHWLVFENVFMHYFYENINVQNINNLNDNKSNYLSTIDKEKIFDKYNQISKIFKDTLHLNFDKGDSIKKIISIISAQ